MVGVLGGASGGAGGGGGVGVGVGVGVAGDVIGGGEGEDLRRAAAQGNTKKLLTLLEEGAAVNLTDECGRTALHWACTRRQPNSVAALLLNGAKVNLSDSVSKFLDEEFLELEVL
ncbi:protein VAPYRIN-like, partial [Homarus americanus]|uniref:protein VAPYRIN-like n=1 Tax=Homarus americanus TaxID=6706 RepID=UPI001C468CD3